VAGRTLEGDLHRGETPVPSSIEVYGGEFGDVFVALALARADGFDEKAAETFLSSLAGSLRPAKE
jgi:hypothetical protein